MEEDQKNSKDMAEAPAEQKTRATPKPNESAPSRDRTSELPSDELQTNKLEEAQENANNTANQTIDEGNEEVQGKLAVPYVEVMKRGQTRYTDENGNYVKKLNAAEPNAVIAEDEKEDYLRLHEEVLNGADPLKATLKYQAMKPEEAFSEGKLANAEEHPRTGAQAVVAEENNNDR